LVPTQLYLFGTQVECLNPGVRGLAGVKQNFAVWCDGGLIDWGISMIRWASGLLALGNLGGLAPVTFPVEAKTKKSKIAFMGKVPRLVKVDCCSIRVLARCGCNRCLGGGPGERLSTREATVP
jgi:hypothetical protein